MGDFNRPGVALTRPVQHRSRLAEVRDRLAGAFATPNQRRTRESHQLAESPRDDESLPLPWEEGPAKFPLARQGYDRPAVDEYVSELEQELIELEREVDELRAQAAPPSEVTSEIKRVGEQTSAILIAAHEQAQQTTRLAQEQADQCIADAAAKALAMTSQAKEELAELARQNDSVREERGRLIGDVRRLSGALATLADGADRAFADEADQSLAPEDA